MLRRSQPHPSCVVVCGWSEAQLHVVHHHTNLNCPATPLRRYSELADSSVSQSSDSSELSSEPESFSKSSSESSPHAISRLGAAVVLRSACTPAAVT